MVFTRSIPRVVRVALLVVVTTPKALPLGPTGIVVAIAVALLARRAVIIAAPCLASGAMGQQRLLAHGSSANAAMVSTMLKFECGMLLKAFA